MCPKWITFGPRDPACGLCWDVVTWICTKTHCACSKMPAEHYSRTFLSVKSINEWLNMMWIRTRERVFVTKYIDFRCTTWQHWTHHPQKCLLPGPPFSEGFLYSLGLVERFYESCRTRQRPPWKQSTPKITSGGCLNAGGLVERTLWKQWTPKFESLGAQNYGCDICWPNYIWMWIIW